jgi:glycogen debranching enzyme
LINREAGLFASNGQSPMNNENLNTGDSDLLVTSAMGAENSRTIKHANTFAVFNHYGEISAPNVTGDQGLYHNGTRFLSAYEFVIENEKPLLLSSDITRDNHLITVDLTNPDLISGGNLQVRRGVIHVFRSKFLWKARCFEKYRIKNYGRDPLDFSAAIRFASDFADIFEVRGMCRERKGKLNEGVLGDRWVEISYEGLDGITRITRIEFSIQPESLNDKQASFAFALAAGEEIHFEVIVSCLLDAKENRVTEGYLPAYQESVQLLKQSIGSECAITTSDDHLNTLLKRATSDLRMLLTDEDGSLYPYAGIPWFCTPFGRDGLITALLTLWFNADISRGVLSYLAAHQADHINEHQDAEPGKILHEIRMGEMTNTGELPFSKYYGSADATPLFIFLCGKYLQRSGDVHFARKMWPHIERALKWIDHYGDQDGDGFVEYAKKADHGIDNQAWKDSFDSVFHIDGDLARAPIAICEVQAYVFAAKKQAAFVASQLGFDDVARDLALQADSLQKRFEQVFWDPSLPGYVLALDHDKKPCRVRASNMGHLLYTGIASPSHARITVDLLMEDRFFSGWGIRTLAQGEPRYNPMSYHNGSIWPHDNAMIAEGFAGYGFKPETVRVFKAMCDMGRFTELNRFPELFCGFRQRQNQGPTLYPVACAPQAWAAASIFSLLSSCLGVSIDALNRQVCFFHPTLPSNLQTITIRNLTVGDAAIDFSAIRQDEDVGIHVSKRKGNVSILIRK